MKFLTPSFMVVVLLALGGCASEPFVYDASRFDRSAAGFGQTPVNISEVVICYGKSSTTPARIITMAKDACGAFGKSPVFIEQTYLECPVIAPVAAVYRCENPDEAAGFGSGNMF